LHVNERSNYRDILYNVFTPTRKALDFKQASQLQGIHKYMKEHEDVYLAVVRVYAWWR